MKQEQPNKDISCRKKEWMEWMMKWMISSGRSSMKSLKKSRGLWSKQSRFPPAWNASRLLGLWPLSILLRPGHLGVRNIISFWSRQNRKETKQKFQERAGCERDNWLNKVLTNLYALWRLIFVYKTFHLIFHSMYD